MNIEISKLTADDLEGIYEVEHELKQYYIEKDKTDKTIQDEFECDLVSTRIVQLLEEDNFELSVDYIKYIHEYLFKDVYEFAGEFRKVDFSKHERILNNDSVAYGDHKLLEQSLDYDITLEKNKNYKEVEKNCKKALKIKNHQKTYINETFSYDNTIYDLLAISTFYNAKYRESLKWINKAIKMESNKRLLNNKKIIEDFIKKNNIV